MRKQTLTALLAGMLIFFSTASAVYACTNILITRGASTDGSTMISYSADAHVLYGELYHWPAATHPEGAMVDIYEWDTGKFLGQISQVPKTFNVVGNINEFQLAIAETTFGGLEELGSQSGAIMDYGSLIYVTLQRAKNAREAIKIMTQLVAKYGYYSKGESFSIADPYEVWIMELIGKGEGQKGAVWVAKRIPDGYVSAHANQARIQTFPLAGRRVKNVITCQQIDRIFRPEIEVVYSYDVISFAREKGWFNGKDEEFSFSDTYNPLTFGGARFCEARVWAVFRQLDETIDKHLDYAMGHNLTNRMPLWIKPNRKVSLSCMMTFMRDTYEGTPLSMTNDIGAGPFGKPYRWRPLTFEVDGVRYCNERAIATQQTAFAFVSQSRSWLPDPIGGILWFGVDDAGSTVFIPMYCSMEKAPENFAVGNGAMMQWSETSAFWIFNKVANLAYTRYNVIIEDIRKVQRHLEDKFIAFTPATDQAALELYKQDRQLAVEFLTTYSIDQAAHTFNRWRTLYQELFMKYMDGNIKYYVPGQKNPKVVQPGYGEEWNRRIVNDTEDHLRVIE